MIGISTSDTNYTRRGGRGAIKRQRTHDLITVMQSRFTVENARDKWLEIYGPKFCPSKTQLAAWIRLSKRCICEQSTTSGIRTIWVRLDHLENTVEPLDTVEKESNGNTYPHTEKNPKNTHETMEEKQ